VVACAFKVALQRVALQHFSAQVLALQWLAARRLELQKGRTSEARSSGTCTSGALRLVACTFKVALQRVALQQLSAQVLALQWLAARWLTLKVALQRPAAQVLALQWLAARWLALQTGRTSEARSSGTCTSVALRLVACTFKVALHEVAAQGLTPYFSHVRPPLLRAAACPVLKGESVYSDDHRERAKIISSASIAWLRSLLSHLYLLISRGPVQPQQRSGEYRVH
jgi:hypothetical protein